MRIICIGMGGTGTYAARMALRHLNSMSCSEKEFVMIDGDSYSVSNVERQDFDNRLINFNKAEAKYRELSPQYPQINMSFIPEYLSKDNIPYTIRDGDVVLLAVDCYKTIKLVDTHCSTLNNVMLIMMSNEYDEGQARMYCRVEGQDLTPSLRVGHPEIANAHNTTRSEMSCDQIANMPGGGQLMTTNAMGAVVGIRLMMPALEITELLTKANILPYKSVYFDGLRMLAHTNNKEGQCQPSV